MTIENKHRLSTIFGILLLISLSGYWGALMSAEGHILSPTIQLLLTTPSVVFLWRTSNIRDNHNKNLNKSPEYYGGSRYLMFYALAGLINVFIYKVLPYKTMFLLMNDIGLILYSIIVFYSLKNKYKPKVFLIFNEIGE